MIIQEEVNSSVGVSVPTEQISRRSPFLGSQYTGIINERFAPSAFPTWKSPQEEVERKLERPKINILDERFPTNQSGVSNILGPPQPPVYEKPYEITEVARRFIMKQKKSVDLNKNLNKVSNRILEFMNKQSIKSKVIIDLEVDAEYDDWIEPRIRVLVEPSKFEQAYELFKEILDFSLKEVHKRETERFMITLDAM